MYWTGGGSNGYFILYKNTGQRYVYDVRWTKPDDPYRATYFFLGRIESPQYQASGGPAAVQLSLAYADPNLGCPGLDPVHHPGSTPGAPYLHSATTADGTTVLFYYKALPSYPIDVGPLTECVLDRIAVQDQLSDAGINEKTVAQYTYVADGGSAEWAGLLRAVTLPEYSPPRVSNYSYNSGSQTAFIETQSGYVKTTQVVSGQYGGNVTTATGGGRSLSLNYLGQTPAPTCTGGFGGKSTWMDSFSSAGDGIPGSSIAWTRTLVGVDAEWQYDGTRIANFEDGCDAGACNGMSPGTRQWVNRCNGTDYPVFATLQAVKDKRNDWRYYDYQRPDGGIISLGDPDAGTGLFLPPEEREERLGAVDNLGNGYLEGRKFSFTYGGVGQAPRAYETLLDAEERDSVGAPSGTPNAKARIKKVYDLNTNRLKAVIKSGWTNRFDTNTQSWFNEQKFSGTFYFTSRLCTGESTADPLGRTLEVHGPCWVADETATDCPAGVTAPVTQYFYWPSTETVSNRANRLQRVSRYANTGGPLACTGYSHLDTTYNAYDIRGNPTEVVDSNGVPTTSVYEGDTLKSISTAGLTTTFAYDNGKVTAIQYPQGNYQVFCYRTGTSGPACTGGTWTPLLQWKAKASTADGSIYSEKVVYAYWPDFTVQSETYVLGPNPGEVRRVRQYAADAHHRPAWEQWGDSTGQFAATRGFDGADNLSRIGLPYNAPPPWCIASGQPSTNCAQLTYNRANRLAVVDEFPASGSNPGIRTCLDHDAHGNVMRVSPGCQTSQLCDGLDGGTSSCTTAPSDYKYDDFGNVIEATLPWLDNGSGGRGTIRYEYDAQGNLLTKQSPAMMPNREWLAYTYDMLGRVLSATHSQTLPTPLVEVMYQLAYDNSQSISGTCSDPMVPANTNGRLLLRTDSFGQTWYRYDAWGRVVREIRLRDGTCGGSVDNNPYTSYTYTANGKLASITYPHATFPNPLGRTVTYVYGSGASTDRVSEVDVTIYSGGTSWSTVQAITNVAWEPYGGLRAYQINHPNSANSSSVQYFLGDNAASPGCPTSAPSSNDHTGRLRALRVATGALTLGSSSGDIYKRTYTWQADQAKEIDTCVLGAATPITEQYTYDQLLRQTQAIGTGGGAFGTRSYSYDGRSNRIGQSDEVCPWNLAYGATSHPDQLTTRASGCPQAILGHTFGFDGDGRVTAKTWPNDSSGGSAYALTLTPGPSDSGAIDSVYKSISVNGATYGYFYDAFGRRRSKQYPLTMTDEYFHNRSNQLLSDTGVDSLTGVAAYPQDDYVWLGGRPVAVVHGKFDLTWNRLPDSTVDCTRNDELASCDLYFIVSDHIGKPVLMLDSARRVAGAADYDPFGQANRAAVDKETLHPYAHNSNVTIADFTQPPGNLNLRMRVLFHLLDVQDSPNDYAQLTDAMGTVLAGPFRGYHSGQIWSPWVQPNGGRLLVSFTSGAINCCPNGLGGIDCTCPQTPDFPYTGLIVESYEYQRYQAGASPFWTALRFPGHYYDAESDLFENWNRYYDSSIGRYLQPEPLLLRDPSYIEDVVAQYGAHPAAYTYAFNNPLFFTDQDGLGSEGPPGQGGGPGGDPGGGDPGAQCPSPPDTRKNCIAGCVKAYLFNINNITPGLPDTVDWGIRDRYNKIREDCIESCKKNFPFNFWDWLTTPFNPTHFTLLFGPPK
jgi:RHS repeat-associated protein